MKYPVLAWTLGLTAVPGTALAHLPGPPGPLASAASGAHAAHHHWHASALPLVLLLALGSLTLAWAIRRDRRVVPALLTLVLGFAGAEAAYHGVHHLGDHDAAEKCVVFAASGHVEGLADDRPPAPAPEDALEAVPPGRVLSAPALSLAGLHEGRAPPSSSI